MPTTRAREFAVYLHDRPGELAGVLEALSAGGAEPLALVVTEHNGRGLVRLLAADEPVVRRVFESLSDSGAGPIAETDVLLVEVPAHPGAFRDVAISLADRGINIRYAYHAPSMNGTARFVLRADDLDAAQSTLDSSPTTNLQA